MILVYLLVPDIMEHLFFSSSLLFLPVLLSHRKARANCSSQQSCWIYPFRCRCSLPVVLKNIHKTALEKLEASLEKLECPSGFGCFPVSEDEFHYLECVKWKPTLRRCPDQSVFNASLGICTLFD